MVAFWVRGSCRHSARCWWAGKHRLSSKGHALFRDGRTVEVKEGEILIVPKGVEHRPHTNGEIVFNLLFEPKATLHTGTVESELTVKELEWI